MTAKGTLLLVAEHLTLAMQPLRDAVADLDTFQAFMLRLGWEVDSLPAEYSDLGTLAEGALNTLGVLGDEPDASGVLAALQKVRVLHDAIKELAVAPDGVEAAEFLPEIGERLFELLLVDYLAAALPQWYNALAALDIIDDEDHKETVARPGFLRTRLRLEQIPQIVRDPLSIPTRVYGWGSEDIDFQLIAEHGAEFCIAIGRYAFLVQADPTGGELVDDGTEEDEDPLREPELRWTLKVPLMVGTIADTDVEIGLAVRELPAEDGKLPGIVLLPLVPAEVGSGFEIDEHVTLRVPSGIDLSSALGIILRPGELSVRYPFQPEMELPPRGFGVSLEYRADAFHVLLGDPAATHLQVQGATIGLNLDHDGEDLELRGTAALEDLTLMLAANDQDGFISELLDDTDATVPIPLAVEWSSRTGLGFAGGVEFESSFGLHRRFGPVAVREGHVGLRATDDSAPAPRLVAEVGVALGGTLGPVAFALAEVGLRLVTLFEDGNAGPFDIAVGYQPPAGIGLAIEAGNVAGGGYLYFDAEEDEYAGVLELSVGPVSVKAIGMLSTRVDMPDGSEGWALLLLVYAQFPPIHLSFGFTLNGVGGVIGLHHAVSTDALISGMRDGVLDDLLFPEDPVANAPRTINRLRVVFPVTPRAVTFGLMFELGWGTPAIVNIRLGLIAQLDNVLPPGGAAVEFTRFVLIGQVRVQMLPRETWTPPLLKLLVDIPAGFYDAEQDRFGFAARLRDSRVADITLTGMLIVRADFGADGSFLLAAGGFHPRFTDIPAGTPAPIDRLAVDFSIGPADIWLEGYFAVAAATVQVGASLRAKAKIGPVSLDGWMGFDAIFFFEPRFHFEADLCAGVAVKYRGHSLASVDFKGTLSGPGLWRITGSVSFEVLWWDIGKSFDESIGAAPETPDIEVDAAALIRNALTNPGNWAAQLPAGGQAMVTLGEITGIDGLLAHPLGRLAVLERVAPLGVTLQRFGNARIIGPDRFDITEVRAEGQALAAPAMLIESFTRAHFIDMTEEEKLAAPSFERFTAGISVGTDAFTVPADQPVGDLEYETHYLRSRPARGWYMLELALVSGQIGRDDLMVEAKLGAVARSELHRTDALRPESMPAITVTEAPLAGAATSDLSEQITLTGAATYTSAVAAEILADAVADDVQLVEAFELAGAPA